jgi:hypothetical protein
MYTTCIIAQDNNIGIVVTVYISCYDQRGTNASWVSTFSNEGARTSVEKYTNIVCPTICDDNVRMTITIDICYCYIKWINAYDNVERKIVEGIIVIDYETTLFPCVVGLLSDPLIATEVKILYNSY